MSEVKRDRGIIALWLLTGLVLFAAAMSTCEQRPAEAAQTDGSAEPMVVSWTGGSLPSLSGDGETGGDGGRGEDTIQVLPAGTHFVARHGTTIAPHPPEFRHLVHESGPAGCVYTGELRTPTGLVLHSGGGRECPRAPGDRRCGYIAQGYSVFAVAGQSCAAAGIAPCTGPFCY